MAVEAWVGVTELTAQGNVAPGSRRTGTLGASGQAVLIMMIETSARQTWGTR